MDKSAKVEKLRSGHTTAIIDGKEEHLLNLDAVLKIGLSTAGDLDGINILTMAKAYREELIPAFLKDNDIQYKIHLNILNCTDISKVTNGMLFAEDLTKQLLYAIRYAELVAKKVANPLNNQINQLKQEYNNVVLKEQQTNILWNSAIQNEARANSELSKCKKKHDKEIRVLEHKIADLEKEIERLKNK